MLIFSPTNINFYSSGLLKPTRKEKRTFGLVGNATIYLYLESHGLNCEVTSIYIERERRWRGQKKKENGGEEGRDGDGGIGGDDVHGVCCGMDKEEWKD